MSDYIGIIGVLAVAGIILVGCVAGVVDVKTFNSDKSLVEMSEELTQRLPSNYKFVCVQETRAHRGHGRICANGYIVAPDGTIMATKSP